CELGSGRAKSGACSGVRPENSSLAGILPTFGNFSSTKRIGPEASNLFPAPPEFRWSGATVFAAVAYISQEVHDRVERQQVRIWKDFRKARVLQVSVLRQHRPGLLGIHQLHRAETSHAQHRRCTVSHLDVI